MNGIGGMTPVVYHTIALPQTIYHNGIPQWSSESIRQKPSRVASLTFAKQQLITRAQLTMLPTQPLHDKTHRDNKKGNVSIQDRRGIRKLPQRTSLVLAMIHMLLLQEEALDVLV